MGISKLIQNSANTLVFKVPWHTLYSIEIKAMQRFYYLTGSNNLFFIFNT